MRRLALVRHARTSAVRHAAFPVDEPLDDVGRNAAAALSGSFASSLVLCSPTARTRQTCFEMGLGARVTEEAALAECDFGTWAGRTLTDVHADDPAGVKQWMTDPDAAPHGGESLRAFCARVGAWLDQQASLEGSAVAVTHGGVIKAALVHAIGAPVNACWRLDVTPLRTTELHAHDGRWTVARVNA